MNTKASLAALSLALSSSGAMSQAPDAQFDTAIERYEKAVDRGGDNLDKSARSYSTPDGAMVEWVPIAEAKRLHTDAKHALVGELKASELQPLKAYVETSFPAFPADKVIGAGPSQKYLPGPVADELKKDLAAFGAEIERIAQETKSIRLSLRVESKPDAAEFALLSYNGASVVNRTHTNNTVAGIYMGLYKYRIEKPGYKVVESELNLMHSSQPTLHCPLIPVGDPGNALPCSLK